MEFIGKLLGGTMKLDFEPTDDVLQVPNQVLCNQNLHHRLMEFHLARNFFQPLVRNLMKVPTVMQLAIDVFCTLPWSRSKKSSLLVCNKNSCFNFENL